MSLIGLPLFSSCLSNFTKEAAWRGLASSGTCPLTRKNVQKRKESNICRHLPQQFHACLIFLIHIFEGLTTAHLSKCLSFGGWTITTRDARDVLKHGSLRLQTSSPYQYQGTIAQSLFLQCSLDEGNVFCIFPLLA